MINGGLVPLTEVDMKRYMVTDSVTLSFPDGREVVLSPGVHEYTDDVAEHWAFTSYAQALDNHIEEQDDKRGRAGNGKKQSSSDS
ncbi:hypothetical protein O185_20725 [Photorhabdus temperata J3]|uniref:Uncharacterized protein n=2 Tax=Photorhabdus temperata TaxID=574560 RepID=U7QX91_PHOTE|nr:hypothetical protein O185_20725 [Photorhabdus temperata J3]